MGCELVTKAAAAFSTIAWKTLARLPQRPQAPADIYKKKSFIWNKEGGIDLVSHSGMVETPRLQAKPLGGLRYDPRMKGYRKSSHTTYQLNYHFVFIPKYRKPVLRGDVALRLRELIREICADAPHRNTEGPCTARARSSVAERAATAVAEPSNAGDQGEDIAQADA